MTDRLSQGDKDWIMSLPEHEREVVMATLLAFPTAAFVDRPPQPQGEQLALDGALGEQLREEAITRVDEHADEAVKQELLRIGRRLARERERFTTDPIHYLFQQVGGGQIREPRVLGAIMRQLQAEGAVEPTEEFRPSAWAANHRRPIRVWKSLLYRPGS